ncbi:serine hydrolase domain-containing protein [Corallibacter sp.]|uniref:serine hydrolase domain-containing protein n=1 Tax=Corallibacter sp. TaxID=2038084 RepID=UPI003AB27820
MLNIKIILLQYFLLFAFNAFSQSNQKLLEHELDSLLYQYHSIKQLNGVVLVAKQGKVLYQKSFGKADISKAIDNTLETKFSIGSLTKSFTAIAVMQLHERGLLNLHKPIKTYIPELNATVGKLTLHQLMKNASGLPVHLNRITDLEYRDITSEELIELYNNKATLAFEPETEYSYSNLNYQLASVVVEKVSGLSYKAYLKQHVFDPINMKNSGVERTFDYPKDKAKGYDVNDGKLVKSERNYMAYAKGGGDVYTTAKDLLKWDQALYSDKLVSNNSKLLLFNGTLEDYGGYGYGFKIKYYNRHSTSKGKIVRHGGSMYGYICNINRYLDDQVTIIILGNIRPSPIMEINKVIENKLFNHSFI